MKKSQIFKLAHAFAKKVKQKGDSYSACFALALKEIYVIIKESASCIKGGIAQNGKPFVQVNLDDARQMIGKTVNIKELLISKVMDPKLPEWMAVEPNLALTMHKVEITSMGTSFEIDGVKMVRLYGNSEKIVKVI